MNYAATLAVLVVLTFSFPLGLRVGDYLGLRETLVLAALGSTLIFVLAVVVIRWQVIRDRSVAQQVELARRQVAADPGNPRAYFVGGEHLASVLLGQGRRREAAEIIDRYAQLGGAREAEIIALREALSRAERRQRQVRAGTQAGGEA